MKRKLLYLTSIILLSVLSINAQTTTWDFSNATDWPLSVVPPVTVPVTPQVSNYSTNVVNKNLGIYPGTGITDFAVIDANKATWSTPYTFVSTNRLKFGGEGGINPAVDQVFKPTKRFLYFAVAGPVDVTIWFRLGNTSDRTLYVTDGTSEVGKFVGDASTAVKTLTVNYTGGAGNLYIFSAVNAYNIYKIEVTGALGTTALMPALSVDDFQADAASNVYSNGKLVFVSNVKSDTQVDVYGISGILVKSFKTGSDTSFDLNTGIYIVKSKSSEGQKTVKVLVN